ncbi:MAG: FHA domain-containing protein [Blastocatellia bacterium]
MSWERIKAVFLQALDRNPDDRSRFLDIACGGDLNLRSEVESLIRSHERAGAFIERPAFQAAAELILTGEAWPSLERNGNPAMREPVTGWLVCVAGRDLGADYPIRAENNLIGRSKEMHVCITGDRCISRQSHAVITYNSSMNSFKLGPGSSTGLVYLNGDEVSQPTAIGAYDQIRLGQTELMFLPLCGEAFKW